MNSDLFGIPNDIPMVIIDSYLTVGLLIKNTNENHMLVQPAPRLGRVNQHL